MGEGGRKLRDQVRSISRKQSPATHLSAKVCERRSVYRPQNTATTWSAPASRGRPGSGFCPGPGGLLPAPIGTRREPPGDWPCAFPSLSSRAPPNSLPGIAPPRGRAPGAAGTCSPAGASVPDRWPAPPLRSLPGQGGVGGGASGGEMGRATLGGERRRLGAVA